MAAKKTAPKKTPAPAKRAGAEPARPSAARRPRASTPPAADPTPEDFTVRVRMFRQGLGDCHLLTFPRKGQPPFQMLIDFGALNRDAEHMRKFATEIQQAVRNASGKSRLDLIVATHEHKDHLCGFNQARDIFDAMEVGGVWMGWTENPADDEARQLGGVRDKAASHLRAALASPRVAAASPAANALANVNDILRFSDGDDTDEAGRKTIAEALAYLRQRGEQARNMHYHDPGTGPLPLEGVEGVRVYVLGPPRDRGQLTTSSVTKEMQNQEVVYNLSAGLNAALAANVAALTAAETNASATSETDAYQPFARDHRIERDKFWWGAVQPYYAATYDNACESWRRIDGEWLGAFDQLALKLASDTNNTSLVLAFEVVKTGEVLLFVGDAQVGNWQSWAKVEFEVPGAAAKLSALNLLRRTVFYKVGHHSSHNATLKKGGLELMTSDKLVGFIPLDKATAAMQGKKDPKTNKPKGWEMPAPALYKALKEHTKGRLVISDVNEVLSQAAEAAGVIAKPMYCEYVL
jgi:hypothetical protein